MLAKTADLFCSVMSIFRSNLFKSYICRDAITILYTSACYTGIAVHDGVLMFFFISYYTVLNGRPTSAMYSSIDITYR